MKISARYFTGNLQFCGNGVVTATWAITPLQRGRTDNDQRVVRDAHRHLFRALAGREVMIRGLMVDSDISAVVARMLDGVDEEKYPAWLEECERAIDQLSQWALGSRRWFLTVPLRGSLPVQARAAFRAGTAAVADAVNLPAVQPTTGEIEARLREAERLQHAMGTVFQPMPVSVAEQVWTLRHAQVRGWAGDLDPFEAPDMAEDMAQLRGRAAIGEPFLDEGALSDLDGLAAKNPAMRVRRPVLKVVTDDGVATYQSGLVLASPPPGGMVFPGSDYLGRIDDSGFDGDITIRMTVRNNFRARQLNKRAAVHHGEQAGQIDGDQAGLQGLSSGLEEARGLLAEYDNALLADRQEAEVEAVMMATVTGDSAEQALALAADFREAQLAAEYVWRQPIGAQEAMFWAGQPWAQLSGQLRDYRHITTAHNFAAAAPLQSHLLGSKTGILFAQNITSAMASPVLLDLIGAALADFNPAIAFIGELGSGKSYAQKMLTLALMMRGARQISIDTSPTREWGDFFTAVAAAFPSLSGQVQIVDVLNPKYSFDPLRVFGLNGARAAQNFLSAMMAVGTSSPEGQTIAAAMKRRYLSDHHITSMGGFLEHLDSTQCRLSGAKAVASRLAVFNDPDDWTSNEGGGSSLGQVIFDPELPPLDLNCRSIVLQTAALELPDREELTHAHLFEQLTVEKQFGRAFYAMAMRASKDICFADKHEDAIFNTDEFQRITTSPEAERAATEFLRDGRKNRAALTAGTHNGETDLGGPTLSALFGTKVVMRHRDWSLAQASAKWMGRPGDEELASDIQALSPPGPNGEVPEERRGEGFMVDVAGRFGQIKVCAQTHEALREVIKSTPSDIEEVLSA